MDKTQKRLNSLCTPDAGYLAERLASGEVAGILSLNRDTNVDYDGAPLCYKDDATGIIVVVGLVKKEDYDSTCYVRGGVDAVTKLGDKIGPSQTTSAMTEQRAVYFHRLKMLEYYGPGGMEQSDTLSPELSMGVEMTAKERKTLAAETGPAKKSVDLSTAPPEVLVELHEALQARWKVGSVRADEMLPEDMISADREILGEVKKRFPAALVRFQGDLITAALTTLEPTGKSVHVDKSESAPVPCGSDDDDNEPSTAPYTCRTVYFDAVQKNAVGEDVLPANADPDWLYVLNVVLYENDDPEAADPDYDGEIYNRSFIRKVAFPYVHKFREVGIEHEGEVLDSSVAHVVQSLVVDDGCKFTTPDGKEYGEGTWFLGHYVARKSKLAKDIEDGEINGLSIDGVALKVPAMVKLAA